MRLACLALLVLSLPAWAAVPLQLSHQGRLTRADGTPEPGPATLVFSLYRTAAGGSAVWTETQAVPLERGLYAVTLGAKTALTQELFAGGELFLGVAVQGRAELQPRFAVSSSGFAIRAAHAERADTAADVGPKLAAHAADANVHHSATSDGLAITPASVAIKGTQVALDPKGLTLGPQANETLSGAQLATLTGGGNADALHTHAGQAAAAGAVCYTLWGDTACAAGFTGVMTGAALYPISLGTQSTVGAPICVRNPGAGRANGSLPYFAWSDGNDKYIYARLPCAICCR